MPSEALDVQVLSDRPSFTRCGQDSTVATFFAVVLLFSGVVLHPVLKLFYAEGHQYAKAKNTLSVVDTALAIVCLLLVRLVWRVRGNKAPTAWRDAFVRTCLPGLCIFGSIALATLANYESFWAFFTLAPLEILFVVGLSCIWHRQVPTCWQLVAVLIVLCGAALLTADKLRKASGAADRPPDGWVVAISASLLFRFNQALATIVIRSACVSLRERGLADVVDISICKISWACLFCIPYALATEGWPAWRSIIHARGAAFGYLLLSVVITCIFQTANVGLNSRLRSVPATMVLQLTPVVQSCLAIFLAGTMLAGKLRLKWDNSTYNILGEASLLIGAVAYLLASILHSRNERAINLATCEPPYVDVQ